MLPGDRSKSTVIGGADLVQDLVGRVDDVRPERKVLGEGKFSFWSYAVRVGGEGGKRGGGWWLELVKRPGIRTESQSAVRVTYT